MSELTEMIERDFGITIYAYVFRTDAASTAAFNRARSHFRAKANVGIWRTREVDEDGVPYPDAWHVVVLDENGDEPVAGMWKPGEPVELEDELVRRVVARRATVNRRLAAVAAATGRSRVRHEHRDVQKYFGPDGTLREERT